MPPMNISQTADQDLETLVIVGSIINIWPTDAKLSELSIQVASAGGSVIAFDQFELQIQAADGATWETYLSDWSSLIADTLIWKSGTLNTLAHGTDLSAIVRILGPVHAIRFMSAQAGVTASAVTVTITGHIR